MAFISASGIACVARTGAWAPSPRRIAAAIALAMPLIGASPLASVALEIDGLRSKAGIVRVCMTAEAAKFPACQNDPAARRANVPASADAVRFDSLPSGSYAIAVIHDENGNGRLDTFAGIPREGFGFSRNPAIRFGPPRFAAARFTLDNRAVGEAVKLRYLL